MTLARHAPDSVELALIKTHHSLRPQTQLDDEENGIPDKKLIILVALLIVLNFGHDADQLRTDLSVYLPTRGHLKVSGIFSGARRIRLGGANAAQRNRCDKRRRRKQRRSPLRPGAYASHHNEGGDGG